MKLIDIVFPLERRQVLITFVAEHRVDFRQLLKDLANFLKQGLNYAKSTVVKKVKFMAVWVRAAVLFVAQAFLASFRRFLSKWQRIKTYL